MKTLRSTRLSEARLSKNIGQGPGEIETVLPLRITDAMQTAGREMKSEHTVVNEPLNYTLSSARLKAKEVGPNPNILNTPLVPPVKKKTGGPSESRMRAKAIGVLRNMKAFLTDK
jgi:hypothetical protein